MRACVTSTSVRYNNACVTKMMAGIEVYGLELWQCSSADCLVHLCREDGGMRLDCGWGAALIVLNCTTEVALHLGLVGQSSSASAVQFQTPHLSMLPRSVCTAASLTTADRSTLSYRNEVLQGSKVMVTAAQV